MFWVDSLTLWLCVKRRDSVQVSARGCRPFLGGDRLSGVSCRHTSPARRCCVDFSRCKMASQESAFVAITQTREAADRERQGQETRQLATS